MTASAEVVVESLGGLGDGIASLNGKPVFIPKSCPGDRLEIRIVHENRDGYHGAITHVIQPGPQRQEAPCRYFDSCGGCTLQQLAPGHYRDFKTRMLHSALERAGFPSPQAEVTFLPAASRRRVEFKINRDNGRLAFHALRSHSAVTIDNCMVLRPELQSLITPINTILPEYPASGQLYAVSLTAADTGIDMLLTFKGCDISSLPSLEPLCRQLGIARACLRNPDEKPIVAAQIAPVAMRLGGYDIDLPPDAFLQATHEGQALLTGIAAEACANANSVVDLFCGIGTYSFPLSANASMHALEGDKSMVQAVRDAARQHSIGALSVEQRDLFKQPLTAGELSRFDAAIINPPRLGAKAQAEHIAQSALRLVVMISCNPATFARDARILQAGGFTLASASGIDQFVWNQHLEIAAVFRR